MIQLFKNGYEVGITGGGSPLIGPLNFSVNNFTFIWRLLFLGRNLTRLCCFNTLPKSASYLTVQFVNKIFPVVKEQGPLVVKVFTFTKI